MADDIVERLRKREMLAEIGRERPEIYRDAADEIERLRKDVKTAIMGDSAELTDAKKEIERLRQAIEQATKILVSLINDAIREKEHE